MFPGGWITSVTGLNAFAKSSPSQRKRNITSIGISKISHFRSNQSPMDIPAAFISMKHPLHLPIPWLTNKCWMKRMRINGTPMKSIDSRRDDSMWEVVTKLWNHSWYWWIINCTICIHHLKVKCHLNQVSPGCSSIVHGNHWLVCKIMFPFWFNATYPHQHHRRMYLSNTDEYEEEKNLSLEESRYVVSFCLTQYSKAYRVCSL